MENDKIDLRKYINAVKRKWYWGVAVFVLVMGMAITYCVVKMPQYMSYSMMLIEADSDDGAKSMGGMLGLMKSFSIGGFGSASIDNELLILQSHAVKKEMINRLGLNRIYVERNGLQKTLLYKNSPVQRTWVCSLLQEDSTCHRAAKPVYHSHDPILWSLRATAEARVL